MELNTGGDRRNTDRRQGQRRKSCRIAYPADAAPKVLNTDLRVANISTKGILLIRSVPVGEKSVLLTPESVRDPKALRALKPEAYK